MMGAACLAETRTRGTPLQQPQGRAHQRQQHRKVEVVEAIAQVIAGILHPIQGAVPPTHHVVVYKIPERQLPPSSKHCQTASS